MSSNIHLDKFYTPSDTAKYCIDIFFEELFLEYITEVIEPSAGSGSFSSQIDGCIAYDIEPDGENIIQKDFLKLQIPYKKGRAIIGNPPFGDRNNLSRAFYNKSCEIGDFIGFILPVSQLNNTQSLYRFDLIKSVDLGRVDFNVKSLKVCFNIYKRPSSGVFNKKPKIKNDMFTIIRSDEKSFKDTEYTFEIKRRGTYAGNELKPGEKYADTFKIKVFEDKNVEYVKNKILSFDWSTYKQHQSANSISKTDIYNIFKIP